MKNGDETAEIIMLDVDFLHDGETHTIHPVILADPTDTVLIDCGYPGFLPSIEEQAEENGISLHSLTAVLISHHDYDHYGALAELKAKSPHIRVLSSEEDADYICGRKKSLRLQQAERIYESLSAEEKEEAEKFQSRLEAVTPADVDATVRDGDVLPWCGGAEIIATPGHMPGHLSVYIKKHKTLITGDALIAIHGRLRIANPSYSLDIAEAKRSVAKLLAYDIETFICYHGGMVHTSLSHRMHRHLLR